MRTKIVLLSMVGVVSLQAEEKPNVVLILVDDLGFGDVSVNGATDIHTPNLDRLAGMGVNLCNGHSTAATSTPSRYALLTGEYAWRKPRTEIAKGDAGMIIAPDRFTMADLFKQSGYETGVIGKWHLGLGKTTEQDWNGVVSPSPVDLGFDYSYLIPATGDRVPCVFLENGKVVNLDENDPIQVSYKENFPNTPSGKDNPELLRLQSSHGHNHGIINGVGRIGYMVGGKSALWRDEDIADNLVEKAKTFINKERKNPFFLYFATHDIHVPRLPNERFLGKSTMGTRGDAIIQLDWTIGEILKALEEKECLKNTIIVFSSDNGPVLDDGYKDEAEKKVGNHKISGKYRGGKGSAFEGGTKVPFFFVWPEKVKSAVSNALVSQIDLFASFASLLGQKGDGLVDSKGYLDAFMGKDAVGREYIVSQSVHNVLSVVKGDYKYIEPCHRSSMNNSSGTELGYNKVEQLYHISTDVNEQENVATQNPDKLIELRTLLLMEKGRGFVPFKGFGE